MSNISDNTLHHHDDDNTCDHGQFLPPPPPVVGPDPVLLRVRGGGV